MKDLFDIDGKVALVTGGSSGIGSSVRTECCVNSSSETTDLIP